MKFKEIVSLAGSVKSYVEKHHKLPSTANGVSKADYAYILCKSVLNPNKEINKLSFKEAPNPNGDSISKTLTKKEFTVIASDVNKFISSNKRLPNYVSHQGKHININLVTYCMAKIINFYGKNNRLPATCEFKSSIFSNSSSSSGYSTKGGKVCKKLMNLAKMNINTYKDVYTAMAKIFTYDYYYNDIQTQSQTISRKKGNCTDLNQVMRAALLELKYNVQIVRGFVKCNDGKQYGHIWCRIKLNGAWKNIDASAAAKGKSLGTLICTRGYQITDINPSWAVSDDGRT